MSAAAELMDSALDAPNMTYSVKVLANEGGAAGRQRPGTSPRGPW